MMLALGVTRTGIVATVALEAAIAAFAGSIAGVVLAAAGIAAFVRTVGFTLEQRAIALSMPSLGELVRYAAVSGALVAITAIAGAAFAAWLATGRQPWTLLRSDAA